MADLPVNAGGDLQAALNSAAAGDRVLLQAGATFTGQFTFPAKTGRVTVTSNSTLPKRRIGPSDAGLLATIRSGVAARSCEMTGAENWLLDGLRFLPNTAGAGEIIGIEDGLRIACRRLLFEVGAAEQQKRFILGNGRFIEMDRCYVSGVWLDGIDSQCFVAWDGAGPYRIVNNYLAAASENVMFGGADSSAIGNIPSDILVEGNYFTKDPTWNGLARNVKNIFELKCAQRVAVRNNIFERCWVDGQGGTAIVITPRNQDGTAPWTVVRDVLFERNTIRHALHGLSILGYDDVNPSEQTTNITVRHNLWQMTGGRFAILLNECGTIVLDHNTFVNDTADAEAALLQLTAEGDIAIEGGVRSPAYAVTALTLTNALLHSNRYGVRSDVAIAGTASLDAMCAGYTWDANVLAGAAVEADYPAGTTVIPEADLLDVHLDAAYRLEAASSFKNAGIDGRDLGWLGAMRARTAGGLLLAR